MNFLADHPDTFRVRPGFLLSCIALLAAFLLPDAIAHRHNLQLAFLAASGIATAFIWLFLMKEHIPGHPWRSWLAAITCLYLTASIPAFLIELRATVAGVIAHPWSSMYLRPWVHWGMSLVLLGVVVSFFARGRTRVALVTGSILLLIVRFSIPWWWY